MSFFSRLFGGSKSDNERMLHDFYVEMLCGVAGYSTADAERFVSDAIAMCKQQGIEEGTAKLPADFGDRLIEFARMGDPKSQRIVAKALREGATEDDIKTWWNLPDLSRRMVLWSENTFRYAFFLSAMNDEGLSFEDAASRVHKTFSIYGDPDDTTKLTGESRPLPHELRGRVDSFRHSRGPEGVVARINEFPSYNAFVRHAVRNGLL